MSQSEKKTPKTVRLRFIRHQPMWYSGFGALQEGQEVEADEGVVRSLMRSGHFEAVEPDRPAKTKEDKE